MREFNFDGLIGPTHNYGGLSPGNLASQTHGGHVSNPRAAALQGLAKMRFVHGLGVGQALLPPQQRPHLRTLRQLGFRGTDEAIIAAAGAHEDGFLLRLCSSAAATWTANAATVAPSADAADGRVHLTPANLSQMFHRTIEAETTTRILRAIFADEHFFFVHDPLPPGTHFADEGAANHTRFQGGMHLFSWGRRAWPGPDGMPPLPQRFPARQTLEASQAVARLHQLDAARVIFARQSPEGIDAGAFHTDVLAVGNRDLLMLHALAFADRDALLATLRHLVPGLRVVLASERDFPAKEAVASYAFNSQIVDLPAGGMAVVAPLEAKQNSAAHAFLSSIASDQKSIALHYIDVRQSMQNGGGPACLRLRVELEEKEVAAIRANVIATPALLDTLEVWVSRHYREELAAKDLADPQLAREGMVALDALTKILRIGSVYDFQI